MQRMHNMLKEFFLFKRASPCHYEIVIRPASSKALQEPLLWSIRIKGNPQTQYSTNQEHSWSRSLITFKTEIFQPKSEINCVIYATEKR